MLEFNLEVNFTDAPLIEARANYKHVQRIFSNEPFGGENWMLESNISILWQTDKDAPLPMSGFFEAQVHAFHNGDMVLTSCSLPHGLSRDIEIFSAWAQANHWNRPKISDDLIGRNSAQWKYYWDTFLLDSDLFTKKFGEREQNYEDSDNNESE